MTLPAGVWNPEARLFMGLEGSLVRIPICNPMLMVRRRAQAQTLLFELYWLHALIDYSRCFSDISLVIELIQHKMRDTCPGDHFSQDITSNRQPVSVIRPFFSVGQLPGPDNGPVQVAIHNQFFLSGFIQEVKVKDYGNCE